jgi:CheY-like chemotaxis protein
MFITSGTQELHRINSTSCGVREDRPILLIDDDVDFCCLLQIAFEEVHVSPLIEVVHEGWAAIRSLRERIEGEISGAVPRLVLLDLKMPGLNGLEVLRWIRGQPAMDHVPVVVFTGLEEAKEHARAISLGATEVRIKPFAHHDLIREAANLRDTYVEDGALKHAA